MDENVKKIFMEAVTHDTLKNVQRTFSEYKLVLDETFFDYELLKAALERRHITIVHFLLNHCRVRNPKKVNLEETVLHLAMKLLNSSIFNREILRKILKNGASISDKNHNGETALYAAFKGGYVCAVDIALTHISAVNNKQLKTNFDSNLKCLDPKDKGDIINFHIACVRQHNHAVRLYVRHGFDVNSPISLDSTDFSGLNPLLYAASKGNHCVFGSLVEHGDLSVTNSTGQTPLHILYYNWHTFLIESAFRYGNDTKFINSVDNNGVSHFHLSCSVSNPDMAKVFIDKEVDVNSSLSLSCPINPGFSPLHFAVRYNCEKVVQLLLESGADCNKADKEGTTPLHLAIKNNFEKIVKILLESGADCNKIDKKGNTPLHLACEDIYGSKFIKTLLDYKACLDAVNEDGLTPLHKAFYNIKLKNNTIDVLTSKIPRDVNFVDNEGLSHFHIVCTRKDLAIVNDLLRSGVAVDSCGVSGKYSGYTALHFAVLYNQKDVVEMLLKENATVNIKTNENLETPLHLACNYSYHKIKFHEMNTYDESINLDYTSNCKNHLDIIKLLLLYGADVEAKDFLGATPLIHTCTINKLICNDYIRTELNEEINSRTKEIVKILLSNKANVNARTNFQKSILHVIGEKYFPYIPDLTEYLISQGADLHALDTAGLTPLHVAVKSSKKQLVQIFLEHKADVNAKSRDSLIPLHLALQNYYKCYSSSDKNILCSLLENDSNVNLIDENNNTLLQAAIEKCQVFVIEKLLRYGADINMEDLSGNSSVSSLIQWDTPYENAIRQLELQREQRYAYVFHTIFTHVQKLLALGCHVSEKVMTCCTSLRQNYQNACSMIGADHKDNLNSIFDNCVEELNRMRLIKIDNYTSLCDILQKGVHEFSKHVRNSTLVKILEDENIDNNFPLYSFLLKIKFKKGLKRSDALMFAKSSLTRVLKLNLPDLCCDLVLKYLTNQEITNLNAAAKSSYKRKLQDNDSNDTEEPSAKLKKE